MIALDSSILAYAVNRYAPEHARATAILEELVNGDVPWALPWPAVYGFLDLVTRADGVARPLSPAEAWAFARPIVDAPAVRLLSPTPRHAEILGGLLEHLPADTPRADLEIATLLREHGIRELLTARRAMRTFPFLTVRDPIRESWSPSAPPLRRYRVLRTGKTA